ncbi:MAG: sugar ABC transporter substrate-binding protein [Symbiobacteriia bacterium]
MRSRKSLIALVLLAAVLVLSGCSGSGSKPAAEPSKSAAPEPVTLNVWIMPNSPKPDADLLAVTKPFTDANPNVTLNVTVLDWGSAWTKITAAATSGEGPDVLQLGTTWVPAIAAMGALTQVDDKVADVGGAGAYFPASWKTTQVAGQPGIWAVPWFVDARAVYYRTDVFAKAKVDPKEAFKNWDTFKAALQKVNGTEIDGKKMAAIGFPGKNDWNVAHNVMPWVWGAGGSELTADNKASGLNTPEALDGIMFYTGLAREGLVPKAILEKNSADTEAAFANGDFAVLITGPWMIKTFKTPKDQGGLADSIAAKNFAVNPLPEGPKGRFTFFGGSDLSVMKSSKHQKEAWELVKFLSTKDAQLGYAQVSGQLPAMKALHSDPALTADPNMAAFTLAAQYGRSYANIAGWGPVEGVLVKHFGLIWDMTTGVTGSYSRDSIKKELDAAATEVNDLLKQAQ